MSHTIGMFMETVVALLLLATIGYCVMLNNRLKRFKADEHTLKATISELICVTEIAERAIAGLKLTVRECDENIGESLRNAESFSIAISEQVVAGERVLQRLAQVAAAARSASGAPAQRLPDPASLVAAANAIAERTRLRAGGLAA